MNPTPNNPNNPNNPYEQAAPSDDYVNPYVGTNAGAPPPDLDAGAPSLRAAEQQRVNRKALMFLAGIVALLAILALLVFKNASRKDSAEKPSEEQVSVPTLNDANVPPLPSGGAPMAMQGEPIDVQPTNAEQLSPPLPPQQPQQPSPYVDTQSSSGPRPLSLRERRMGATENGAGAGTSGALGTGGSPLVEGMTEEAYTQQKLAQLGVAPGGAQAAPEDRRPKASAAQFLRHPDALLVRGTYLRCVLETHIVSDVAGFTSCIVTEPVYSINGRALLLPRGSKIYGAYARAAKSNRIEVIWDRVTTPTGIDVSMASPGVDNLGGAGQPGTLNSHWGSRITSALLISLLSDVFKYEAAEHGPQTTTVGAGFAVQSPFESNTARTIDRLANQAASEAMSRPPTVTINQGTVVNVYVAKDIDFSGVLGR